LGEKWVRINRLLSIFDLRLGGDPYFLAKNGGSCVDYAWGGRFGKRRFWVKNGGAELETSTNMEKCDEMLRNV
jgi:hypothetical protein